MPRFADPSADSLLAPMPGGVVGVLVARGEAVEPGQPLVVLEAMKVEHTVAAPAAGIAAEVRLGPGDQVDTGQVLAVIEPEEDE